jgi:pimeloyl-ACP methyl ester carboxylesterase
MNRPSAVPFVLVHGAFQGAAVWDGVSSQLRAAGHPVVAVDLPGRPGNPAPPEQVTLEAHRDCVLGAISSFADPVMLVGHSFGGITISSVAQAAPDRIRTLVYVAAYLPQSGQSARMLANQDTDSRWTERNFIIAADRRTVHVLREDCVMLFGEDLDEPERRRLAERLIPEPLLPVRTPVTLTADRFGRCDKVYIRTLRDNTISPQLQEAMLARVPVRKVLSLDSSHSPYLSQPAALAELLLSVCPAAG